MTSSHGFDEPLEVGRVADVLRREGASLDEIEHENAWLCVHHAGAQTRQMRRPARSQLIRAHDPMHEDVIPHPHDVAVSGILDREVLIGNSAGQWQGSTRPDQIASAATRADERSPAVSRLTRAPSPRQRALTGIVAMD